MRDYETLVLMVAYSVEEACRNRFAIAIGVEDRSIADDVRETIHDVVGTSFARMSGVVY